MNKILAALVVLVGIVASVPFFVGGYVEKDMALRIETANKEFQTQWGKESHLRIAAYHRGWLRSVAELETKLAVRTRGQPQRDALVTSRLTIEHGPLPELLNGSTRTGWALAHSEVDLAEMMTSLSGLAEKPAEIQAAAKVFAGYPPVRSRVWVEFDGSGEWSAQGEPFEAKDAECCSRLAWSAISLQGHVAPNMVDSEGTMRLEKLEVVDRGQKGSLLMDQLGLLFDFKKGPSGAGLGKVEWQVKKISWVDGKQPFEIEGLTFGVETSEKGPATVIRVASKLGSAEGAGPDGAQRSVGWNLGFELDGLDTAALEALKKEAEAMGGEVESPANSMKIQELVLDLAERSLSHEPSVALAPFSIKVDGQQVEGNLELGLAGANLAALMANPGSVTNFLKGNAKLSLPEELLGLFQVDPEQAEKLVQQGLIRREGSKLVAEAQLSLGGKLILNGIPVDLPRL